jgi:hypothetical protein
MNLNRRGRDQPTPWLKRSLVAASAAITPASAVAATSSISAAVACARIAAGAAVISGMAVAMADEPVASFATSRTVMTR